MATFFFSPKCQKIDIWNKNSKILLSLIHEKSDFWNKNNKKMLSLIQQKRDSTGEAEAEAEARRGEARRRQRGGRARAAPRRARAAGIHDAFLRPHANFQFFCSKSCFWMFDWWAFVDLINSKACTNVWKLLNWSDRQKVINQTFKNMIYCQNIFQKCDLLVNKVLKVCLRCVFDTDDSM